MVPDEIALIAPDQAGVWSYEYCPYCTPSRRNRKSKTLGVVMHPDRSVGWCCHHCGEKGRARMTVIPVNIPLNRTSSLAPVARHETDDFALSYMEGRGISEKIYRQYGCFQAKRYFPKLEKEDVCIGFPVIFNGKEKSCKFRALSDKAFAGAGSPPVLFGFQLYDPEVPHILIAEGEIDAMSWAEAGIANAMSLPSGASVGGPEKQGYLWGSKVAIENSKRVYVALDDDEPGHACAEELARRVGKHKVYVVKYPEGCKDANDVLQLHGKEKLVEVFSNAAPWPVSGLYDTLRYSAEVMDLIIRGEDTGLSTGLSNLDGIYKLSPAKLNVVTGIPGSGKSELIDQIMVNAAEQEGWRFAICSFENHPKAHIKKILEKRTRTASSGMPVPEIDKALGWCQNHFFFIRFDDGQPCRIDDILERARIATLRYGIRGLVIDPFNYIQRDTDVTETQFISDMLTKCRQFTQSTDCVIFFVAHPAKLMRVGGTYPMPGGYDISGSAAWYAKADAGLTVGRGRTDGVTIVECWKQRDKGLGNHGTIALAYDKATGIFSDGAEKPIEVAGNGEDAEDQWWSK